MLRTHLKAVFLPVLFGLFSTGAFAAAGSVSLPEGTLTAEQIKEVFVGNTAAADVAAGNKQKLVIYFGPDGTVRQAESGRLSKGKWKIRKDDRLCVSFKGAGRDCRIIVKDGNKYRQYAVKLDGNHKHELTYVKFEKGNQLAKMSKSPILPPGTLDKQQLVKLFSGKTVESVTVRKGRTSLTYYAPDGSIVQDRKGHKRYGKWRVKKNGRICIQMENLKEKCRIVVKDGGEYKKYIVRKNGRHQHSVTYRTIADGNQL